MANLSLAELISDIRIYPVKSNRSDSKTVAFVRLTIADQLAIGDMKIIEGQNGLFVGMPSRQGKDQSGETKYFDVAYPVTKEAREELQELVLKAYEEQVGGDGGRSSRSSTAPSRSSRTASSSRAAAPARAASRPARPAVEDDDVPF